MSLDLSGPDWLSLPVHHLHELIDYVRGAERPRAKWLVGVEHEKIGVQRDTLLPAQYQGEGGIRALLDAMARAAGGKQHQHKEDGQAIALLGDNASVTLEPGGQLELSGAPSRSFAAIAREIELHLKVVRDESARSGARWLGVGYRPFGPRDAVPFMPKGRYAAMRASLGSQAPLALDMMLMTATVQANLDWSDEDDLAKKVRASTAISPVVTALFANSPIVNDKESGYLDFRYQVWRETDPARCGLLEQMVQPGWSYQAYVEWALDVPMLFVRRNGEYQSARGQTFRQWMTSGKLASGEVAQPLYSNWADQLSTLFPEVRVKRVLELRGADVVPLPYMLALPALWAGLLYDKDACAAAWELTRGWSFPQRLDFQADVAVYALDARGPGSVRALDLARELLKVARTGLAAWDKETGEDSVALLDPLQEIAESGKTLAERALEAFRAAGNDPQALIRFWQIA